MCKYSSGADIAVSFILTGGYIMRKNHIVKKIILFCQPDINGCQLDTEKTYATLSANSRACVFPFAFEIKSSISVIVVQSTL